MRIEQPRDRQSSFEPQIVRKHQRRFDGFDDKIVALYGRGMSVRETGRTWPSSMASRSGTT